MRQGPSPPGSLSAPVSGTVIASPRSTGKSKDKKKDKKGWFSKITGGLGLTAEADESGTDTVTLHSASVSSCLTLDRTLANFSLSGPTNFRHESHIGSVMCDE
jgi:hypothetical protein